jgi:hypothetical protein
MKRIFGVLIFPFLLIGCGNEEVANVLEGSNTPYESNVSTEQYESQQVANDFGSAFEQAISGQLLFKEDQSTAYFTGTGNEYASYSETTYWISYEYVQVITDNGGTTVHEYYKIEEDAIYLLATQTEDQLEDLSLDILKTIAPIELYLKLPLTVGTSFNGWNVEDRQFLSTAYEQFDDAFILTKDTPSDMTTLYIAPGFGVVKRVVVLKDTSETTITSELSSIQYNN